ncbi:flagellar filament capping protein FliD [Shewanella algae]|uniref:flagellar filament capping protein FliD n=1 Tax=Shewanella algae TaxID=38313 RepID=UPI001AAD25D8|nr:flagellar filament capping protein FliD [Shewanella algae]MBO2655896.1 flagellar filament capping protein FliD [Shewanella algae]
MISGMSGAQFAQQLISAERAGKDNLYQSSKTGYQKQLDAYTLLDKGLDRLNSKLTTLGTDAFKGNIAEVTDENISVSSSAKAPQGNFQLSVEQLAQAHQLVKPFASEDATLPASGVIQISMGGKSMSVDLAMVNSGGSVSVSELRDMINQHPNNPGVQASLVRTGGQVQLMLTSKETGKANSISISLDGADWGMVETQAAQDAKATLNGMSITSASNMLTQVVDGVDIELRKVHEAGDSSNISIKADQEAGKEAVKAYVDTVNELLRQISQLTRGLGVDALDDSKDKDDKDSKSSKIDDSQLGILKGDTSLRTLQQRLRELSFQAAPNGLTLADAGIELTRNGELKLDEKKLENALKTQPQAISDLFGAKGGMVDKVQEITKPYTRFDGYMDMKKNNLKRQLDRVEDNMERHNRMMEQRYQIYLKQFTAMETTINELNSASGLFY